MSIPTSRPHRRMAIGGAVATSALAAASLTAPMAGAATGDPQSEAGIQAVRTMTAKYHDEAQAFADGFLPTDECVPGMGYHYVNPDRIDKSLEPTRPEALLYAVDSSGDRVLAGAEWIVVDADQDLATDDDRPSLFGHPFDGPMPGHFPGMPVHYDLHAYAWVANPDGSFATWNPAISCPEG